MRYLILSVLLFLLASCAFAPVQNTSVEGRVGVDGLPLDGIRVGAWAAHPSQDLSTAPRYLSDPSGERGLFHLELPPGRYYLMVRSGNLFAFYGRNPVTVGKEPLSDINLALVLTDDQRPARATVLQTGIQGQVVRRGEPVGGATVHVYTDLAEDLKGMGYQIAGPTSADGFFELDLSPGTYYLVARLRGDGSRSGPLTAGDALGYYPGNPVRLDEGEVARVKLPLVEVPEAVKAYAEELFGKTSIRGRVLDAEGEPLAGMRVLLYDDPAMLDRPLYVSPATDEAGRYILTFPEGGQYYLSARSALGAAPSPGELYGTYDETLDHSVEIDTGERLKGIDIRVEEMW